MKQPLFFSLLLAAALALAACGGGGEETAVPMPADGGDEALIQLDPSDPLANYLDLSQLTPETLAACRQTLALESQDPNCAVTLQQVMGDASTLYLSLTFTYPDAVSMADVADPQGFAAVLTAEGGKLSGGSLQVSQTGERTLACLLDMSYGKEVLTPGKAVTLTLTDPLKGSSHTFQWTVATQGPTRQAHLKDQEGAVVGTLLLSPFALTADLSAPAALDAQAAGAGPTLLDGAGNPLPANPAAGEGSLSYRFFSPVEPDQVATVQLGPYTAQLTP